MNHLTSLSIGDMRVRCSLRNGESFVRIDISNDSQEEILKEEDARRLLALLRDFLEPGP